MAVTVDAAPDKKVVTITIEGRFDFTLYREFRDAYAPYTEPGTAYVLNLAKADYLDSSALGMLLQLREHGGGEDADVRLVKCRPSVARILKIANFHRLFVIEAEDA